MTVRFFLRKPELSPYQKWQLIAELFDRLEQDYLTAFPDEPPIFPKGFREALFELVFKLK